MRRSSSLHPGWTARDIQSDPNLSHEGETGCEAKDVEDVEEKTTKDVNSNTNVDIKMNAPQLSLEILVCDFDLAGVIFFVCLLIIACLPFKSQKNSDVYYSKLWKRYHFYNLI